MTKQEDGSLKPDQATAGPDRKLSASSMPSLLPRVT